MAYTTINKQIDHFNTATYTGTGSNQTISNTFQSDMIWVKGRNYAYNHSIQDAVRGFSANKVIYPNLTNVEGHYSDTGYIQSVASNNFVVGTGTHSDDANYNDNGSTYVSWNWKAGGGQGSSNTDGSISSTVSASTTSGFSIVTYTGTGANATVGHGLGVAPKMIILKNRSTSSNWQVYHTGLTSASYTINLDATSAQSNDSTYWNGTDPTSSVFSVGTNFRTNGSGNNLIAYCFADVKGFSKFGEYVGNGSTDGTFVYTGFKPAFVIVKRYSNTGTWLMLDNKRNPENAVNKKLFANLTNAEATADVCDFLSNGFKLKTTDSSQNDSGQEYIYMAFAEAPLVGSNNIPCTAR